MAAGQQWLFAPAQPLVERLGRQFFRKVPAQPGVYLMRDPTGDVVYVGKAKNLRQRLRSYRIANPERMPRRHIRMVREVARIDFDLCRNEPAALAREAKLLRELKPKFNRAGVWPGKAQFLTWRFNEEAAQFSVQEIPPLGWERFGSLGGYAPRLHGVVVRLLWLALHPQTGFSRLPQPEDYCRPRGFRYTSDEKFPPLAPAHENPLPPAALPSPTLSRSPPGA